MHTPLIIILLVSLTWTVLFSLSSNPGIRGYRNLGILSCYIVPVGFLFSAGWRAVGITWLVFGVVGGVIYTLWELLQRIRTQDAEKPKVGFGHILPGQIMWPVMIPEALEYSLTELGLLKPNENKN